MKKIIIALLLALQGCAYHASDIPKNDLVVTDINSKETYQQVFRNINQGADLCKFGFVREGYIYTDIKEAKITLYLRSMLGGSSGMLLGYIDIKESPEGSFTRINLWNVYERSGNISRRLSNWAKGDTNCE